MKLLLLPIIMVCIVACNPSKVNLSTNEIDAYVPRYLTVADTTGLVVTTPKATVKAGKIYAYGNYIFQNEINKGFHIINNTVPANAQKVAFLNVPTSTEISIKGNYLYTNNCADMVVFDISNITAPVLVNRLVNAFPLTDQNYPPVFNCYFVCADASKGKIIDWELKKIPTPSCRR